MLISSTPTTMWWKVWYSKL